MKTLTSDQVSNLTVSLAWKVADSYAKYLETSAKFIEFETVLEYSKTDILVCLPYLIRHNLHNKQLVKVFCNNIVILETSYIQTPEEYKSLLERKKLQISYRIINNPLTQIWQWWARHAILPLPNFG